MTQEKFTSFTLTDGRKCTFLKIYPFHLWIATYAYGKQETFDITPFLLREVILIEGKKAGIDELSKMDMKDYEQISEILRVQMVKLEIK